MADHSAIMWNLLEAAKRDIGEFVSTVQTDTQAVSDSVKSNVVSTVSKSMGTPKSRKIKKSGLIELQSNVATYSEPPCGEAEEEAFEQFCALFHIEENTEDIANV